MDAFSALKSEVFRPLAAVVIPGVFAIAPFVIISVNALSDLSEFYRTQSSWFLSGVIAAGTMLGMLLEDVGTSIERGIDRCMDLEYLHGHEKVWLAYLSRGTEDNNGRRYLSATVTRMKFINSMMPALLLFALGILLLHIQVNVWSAWTLIAFVGVVAVVLTWLFRTSTELSEVASITRYCLLPPDERPSQYDVDARTVKRLRHFAYAFGELVTSRGSDIDLRGRWAVAVIPQAFLLFFGMLRTQAGSPSP